MVRAGVGFCCGLQKPVNCFSYYLFLSLMLVFGSVLTSGSLSARTLNGFDLSDSLIYQGHIMPGGPAKDGIPAIDEPEFEAATAAEWLTPESRVLGVVHNGVAKAYPIAILNWHEIVNDRFSGDGVVITYCPLCGSGVVYSARVGERSLSFGVSGLLYNNDLLLYDRQTDSLWSQLHSRAISGALKGSQLVQLPSFHTRWAAWRKLYPDTLVLTRSTGAIRDYRRNPYYGYDDSPRLFFPVEFMSHTFHPKERVIGIELHGVAKAYPFSELAKKGDTGVIDDLLGGVPIQIEYDSEQREGKIYLAGEELVTTNLFWFAWFAFHPTTEVFRVEK
jgi:hypothetical protein